jgi:hypothetical protein
MQKSLSAETQSLKHTTSTVSRLAKYRQLIGKLFLDENSGSVYAVHAVYWDVDTNKFLAQRRPFGFTEPELGDEEGFDIGYIEAKVKAFDEEVRRDSNFLRSNWECSDSFKKGQQAEPQESKHGEAQEFCDMYESILTTSLQRMANYADKTNLRDVASQICRLLDSEDYFVFLNMPVIDGLDYPWWKAFRRLLSLLGVFIRLEGESLGAKTMLEMLTKNALLIATSQAAWLDKVEPIYVIAKGLAERRQESVQSQPNAPTVFDSMEKLDPSDRIWTGIPVSADPGIHSVLMYCYPYHIL